jgi:hypothetical protein
LIFHHVEEHGFRIEAGGPDRVVFQILVAMNAARTGDLAVLGAGNVIPSRDVLGLGRYRIGSLGRWVGEMVVGTPSPKWARKTDTITDADEVYLGIGIRSIFHGCRKTALNP